MKDIHSIKKYLILGAIPLMLSCSSHYTLVKSNRTEYNMNSTQPVDSTLIKTYLPYKVKMDQEMNTVIGHADVLMEKLDKKDDKPVAENLLRNFFSDALFHEALKYDPTIDFAMPSTNGGIRVALPKGDIKLSNVFEVMPFENEMMVYVLSPADVQNLLEYIAKTGGQPVAGLRMKIVDDKPTEVMINGKPLDPTKNYKILTSDYVAEGGDNVQSFKNPIEKKIMGIRMRDALITYIKENQAAGKTINPKLDGRITKD
ncbi:5'-nucleotidase C-terminal domain-containing protein [Pedobacter gandavensis]|uniref:5'-nucleotidase C-terminal domain-containing protein n=1 Tax=Pedobacter gandavensis TaxID=2679963 RepID=UPI00293007FA|nr:5'-nucleotidase C-terminal domain-containing protein [Pedobacter gandavensis]